MKTLMVLTVGLMAAAAPAMAQSNATVLGTETAPGNASGAPSAQTPAGQLTTTTVQPTTPSPQSGAPATPNTGGTAVK